ncbi:MAG: acetylglutamate kinase [Chitinispirillales bacterium]|jgi:acetylglutamate kinase|nr:acetylglutamate kinase [Chitinispirillales bacterium]
MRRILIKIGGSTVNSEKFLSEMSTGILELIEIGCSVCVVHGGGKDINEELGRLDKEFKFVDGQRVTDNEMMSAVQRVLSGGVNKKIVNEFLIHGINAVGISGVDGNTATAKKLLSDNGNDLGLVGKIVSVNTKILDLLSQNGFVAVVSPVSRDDLGNIYNVNADGAASEIAATQKVDDLIFVSDVAGVKIGGKIAQKIKVGEIENLIETGEITGGMIPKLRGAAQAISRGVRRVHICGWNGKKTLLNETGENSTGTTIY